MPVALSERSGSATAGWEIYRHRHGIAAAAAEKPFKSLEELNTYAAGLMNGRNHWAGADFCGLSTVKMAHLLYGPVTVPETVSFSSNAQPDSDVEIMGIFFALVQAIGESGLKAKAKGNLPLNFCEAMVEQTREAAGDRVRFGDVAFESQV